MSALDQLRARLDVGATLTCLANTYIPAQDDTTVTLVRVGRSFAEARDGLGDPFKVSLPTRAGDVARVDTDTYRWPLQDSRRPVDRLDGHTVTYRITPPGVPDQPAALAELLDGYRYQSTTEAHLHDGVAQALDAAHISYVRECRLGARDRIDLITAAGNGIEVKTSRTATAADVLRQLQRYAGHDEVTALLLVTTRAGHVMLPAVVGGKPLHVVWVRGIG